MDTSSQKIQIVLITGFLGAGKTSLIKSILKQLPNKKIGVLENDFGEVGIDASLLKKRDNHEGSGTLEIVEINDGSIFCSCRHDEFIKALHEIAIFPIDYLFIECSGIADPAPMEKDIAFISTRIGDKFLHIGNICIIDSVNFFDSLEVLEVLRKQIQYSNVSIMNKIDLVSNSTLDLIGTELRKINPQMKIFKTQNGEISYEMLEIEILKTNLPKFRDSYNTPFNSPRKLLLKTSKPVDLVKLQSFFNNFYSETYRIKGYFQTFENQEIIWKYIDGVQKKLRIRNSDFVPDNSQSEIVIILSKQNPISEIILEHWQKEFEK